MSNSDPAPGTGLLRAEGPPAVRIEIIDGGFNKVAVGTERLVETLPEGIYTVRWHGAGTPEEQHVRLFASDEPVTLRGGGSGERAQAPGLDDSLGFTKQIFDKDMTSFLSALPTGGSEICVVVEPKGGKIHANPARSLRLLAADGRELEPKREARGRQLRGRGRSARQLYAAPPGSYRLRYHAADGRLVEQTVQAFAGRRTILFMRYGRTYEMRLRAGDRVRTALRGIDPAASLAASASLAANRAPERGDYQLQEIVLHGLTGGAAALDANLAERIAAPGVDPYAKLYAAALLLRRAGRAGVPAMLDHAREIARSIPEPGWPDCQCLLWALGEGEGDGALALPPMLAQSWQWAVERSVGDPGAVPAGADFDAAADAPSSHLPWLVWNAADARPAPAPVAFDPALLERQMVEIERGMGAIRARLGEEGDRFLLSGGGHLDLPIGLSDASLRLVGDLERARLGTGAEPGARDFILQLGMPAQSLVRRAETTLGEINRLRAELG